jgi:5-formyltetrahydrofolate cyclo-ligase
VRLLGFDRLLSLSDKIREKVEELPEYRNSETIATYVATSGEVQTEQIIRDSLNYGKRVLVPKVISREKLMFSEIKDMTDLARGEFGLLEPKTHLIHEIPLGEAEIILVPLVAWDEWGNRIGHGRGYFDFALANLPKNLKVGLAFEAQRVDRIPREEHDVPLDLVITEERQIRFKL